MKKSPLTIKGIYCACLILFAPTLRAESLKEMIPWAKKYDARYLAARADYEATGFRVAQARSRLLPSLEANADFAKNKLRITYDDPNFTDLDRRFKTRDWSAQLVQPLFRLEEWAGLTRSEKAKKQSYYSLRQAEFELVMRLAQGYYDVLLAKENLNVLESEKRALTERWQAAMGLHKSGAVSGTEPLQIQARLSLVIAAVLEAQWELANKRRILESMAGPNVMDPEPVDESEIEKEWGDLEDWLHRVSENPRVRASAFSLEAAKQDELRAHSGFWPGVDAVGVYQKAWLGPSAALPIETRNRNASAGVRLTWS
ncbi:MAG: TolC family protein, partial [Elusimicrobia bacterium]|nr:TolC family protein [Elusimicrobiota bacterium]